MQLQHAFHDRMHAVQRSQAAEMEHEHQECCPYLQVRGPPLSTSTGIKRNSVFHQHVISKISGSHRLNSSFAAQLKIDQVAIGFIQQSGLQ